MEPISSWVNSATARTGPGAAPRTAAAWRIAARTRPVLAAERTGRLSGPSLPLDIGYSDTIPASIRNAVKLRDLHCQWAGRCDQPASACEVHHTRHKADGGKTSLKDCVLLCRFIGSPAIAAAGPWS